MTKHKATGLKFHPVDAAGLIFVCGLAGTGLLYMVGISILDIQKRTQPEWMCMRVFDDIYDTATRVRLYETCMRARTKEVP